MKPVRLYDLDGSSKLVDYDHPDYEPHTVEAVKKIVKPGWVCYDVGANIGYYTFLLAQLNGGASVVAFEPWPPLADCLTQNSVALDSQGFRVSAHPVGLSDTDQRARRVRRGNDWELLDGPGGQYVDMITLDSFVFAIPGSTAAYPNFMKIDIDGYESRMLRGATRVLKECKPVIVIELAAQAHEHHGQDVRDAINTLHECGYHLFHEDTIEDLTLASGSADRLVQMYVPRGGSINVIARHIAW